MSKKANVFYLLIAALIGAVPVAAQQGDATSEAKEASSQVEEAAAEGGDEDWLNTVWTQVDDMVKEEEFKLQETVTVAVCAEPKPKTTYLPNCTTRAGSATQVRISWLRR